MLSLYALLLLEPAPPPTAEQIMAALNAGNKQWQKDVCFRSTFTYREGRAKSMEAGLRDGIDKSLTDPAIPTDDARGVFHRKGDLIRFSIGYGKPPVPVQEPVPQVPAPLGGRMVRHVSFDEVTDGRIQIRYHPGSSGNDLHVELRRPNVKGVGVLSETKTNVIQPYPNPRFELFKLWKLDEDQQPEPTVSVTTVDDRHKEVVLTHNGKYKQTRNIRFQSSQSPAVVTQISEFITDPEGRSRELVIRLSDFQKCPGGLVARRLIGVSKGYNGPISVREWNSSDLGATQPTVADFIVSIEPTTMVVGLRNAPPRGIQNRQIDISAIAEGDLDR